MFNRLKLDNERTVPTAMIVLITVALILKLVNVFNAPAHWDTGLYLNIAVGYLERGILTPLMWRFNPEWNIVTGSGSGYAIFLVIGWLKIFGVSILAGQLLMYVVGVLNLPVIYMLAKRFYNSTQAGWWAMGFFALSGTFAQDFYIRMDALNILTCSLILLLHLEAVRRDKWWLHAVVGVALVAALEVHILSALYAGGIGLYYAVRYLQAIYQGKRLILWLPAIAFGIGLMLATVVYYLHHIAPNPDIYFMISRSCDICRSPLTPIKEFQRWYWWFGQQPVLSLFMIGLALLSAMRRRSSIDRDYLLLFSGAYLTLLILNPPEYEWYTGHLLPLFALGVGGLYAQGLARNRPQLTELRVLGLAACATAIIVLISGTYFTYSRTYISSKLIVYSRIGAEEEYNKAIAYVRANIPTNAVIVGHETFYLDLVDYHNFISNKGIEELGLELRKETYFDLWQREKPQVFIGNAQIDPDIQHYVTAQGDFVEVIPKLWVEKPLVAQFHIDIQHAN